MSTVFYTPEETDTAIGLYQGDRDDSFYNRIGHFGQLSYWE